MKPSKIKFNINLKILTPLIVALLLTSGVLTIMNVTAQTKAIEQTEQQQVQNVYQAFLDSVQMRGQMAVAMATLVSGMPDVQRAFAAQNREALIDLLHTAYLTLDKEIGVPQAQFHLSPATSFLRLHKLNKYGDDLSAFRSGDGISGK